MPRAWATSASSRPAARAAAGPAPPGARTGAAAGDEQTVKRAEGVLADHVAREADQKRRLLRHAFRGGSRVIRLQTPPGGEDPVPLRRPVNLVQNALQPVPAVVREKRLHDLLPYRRRLLLRPSRRPPAVVQDQAVQPLGRVGPADLPRVQERRPAFPPPAQDVPGEIRRQPAPRLLHERIGNEDAQAEADDAPARRPVLVLDHGGLGHVARDQVLPQRQQRRPLIRAEGEAVPDQRQAGVQVRQASWVDRSNSWGVV